LLQGVFFGFNFDFVLTTTLARKSKNLSKKKGNNQKKKPHFKQTKNVKDRHKIPFCFGSQRKQKKKSNCGPWNLSFISFSCFCQKIF